ncbi:thermonuclease family protein [Bacillus sp. ILBB4]|nr:thermonuclease family protein [Bacillus sp. ILBB4]
MSVIDNLYWYKFRVDRCIDGDTIVGKLDKGRKNFDEDIQIRLNSINCPEISKAKTPEEKAAGEKAKAFVESLILGKEVVVHTYKQKDDDSFARMLADVYIVGDGVTEDIYLNKLIVDQGHAVPYRVRKEDDRWPLAQ